MRRRAGWAAMAGAALLAALWVLTAPPPMPSPAEVRAAWRPSEAALYDRSGVLLDLARVDTDARRGDWAVLADIAPTLPSAVIRQEDRRFLDHGGVDWRALGGAVQARIGGGRSRGASTITMQLAGLLSPELAPPRRTLGMKLRQARAAWAIERRWTKAEVLEAYLNLAPLSGELVGVSAGSAALFGKRPAGLSAAEAAAYAALLPSPAAPAGTIAERACRLAGPAHCARARLAAVLMLEGGAGARFNPGLAPHLSQRLLSAERRRVRTTLDAGLQRFVRDTLARQLTELQPRNARDAAAIVVDNASGDILAYVSASGPTGRARAVDGVAAPRQAGSTLKPHLFALAIEERLLTAASLLEDAPIQLETAMGHYVPRDYEGRFRGPVSVRTALGNSLNIPAVRALVLTGVDPLRDRLHASGYRHITADGDHYGFSLALGSAEVTLLEQAAAYRALARGGLISDLRLVPGEAPPDRRVIAPGAAAIVADILADPAARQMTFGQASALDLPFRAAVKTGTSKAMRDNWAVGFSARVTVGVWVGNFEGDSMTGVSGTSGAAPAWRAIMLFVHADGAGAPPPLPAGVTAQTVRFEPAVEPPRRELFLAGTALGVARLAPHGSRPARIARPAGGAVIALDPDIPPARQKVAVMVESAPAGARLLINGRPAGSLSPLWTPTPGVHRLALTGARGEPLDSVRVTVR